MSGLCRGGLGCLELGLAPPLDLGPVKPWGGPEKDGEARVEAISGKHKRSFYVIFLDDIGPDPGGKPPSGLFLGNKQVSVTASSQHFQKPHGASGGRHDLPSRALQHVAKLKVGRFLTVPLSHRDSPDGCAGATLAGLTSWF